VNENAVRASFVMFEFDLQKATSTLRASEYNTTMQVSETISIRVYF
jgi:hypothetical protein